VVSRRIIHTLLSRIEAGRIDLVETYPGGESRNFGSLAHVGRPLRPRLEIHDPAVYARLVRSRSIGLGTTYAEGLWDCDDLLDLLLIVAREVEKRTRSFANQLIFPGGCLPSLKAIQSSIAKQTDLRTIALEDISASYVRALHEWRDRFAAAGPELEALGSDERFQRLWRLYMAISEAGFSVARIRDVQILFAKPEHEPSLAPAGRLREAAGLA